MASCLPSIANPCRVQSAHILVCDNDRQGIVSCRAVELDEQSCPACRSSTALSAALPLNPEILWQGFDRCRASIEGIESAFGASSSAFCFPEEIRTLK